MSYDSTRVALYTVLNENLTVPIRFETILEDDPITSGIVPWVRCFLDPFDKFQMNMGTSTPIDRTLGHLQIEVYDREQNGFSDILRIADEISTMYMGKSFDSGNLTITRISILNRDTYQGWNSKLVNVSYIESKTRI